MAADLLVEDSGSWSSVDDESQDPGLPVLRVIPKFFWLVYISRRRGATCFGHLVKSSCEVCGVKLNVLQELCRLSTNSLSTRSHSPLFVWLSVG